MQPQRPRGQIPPGGRGWFGRPARLPDRTSRPEAHAEGERRGEQQARSLFFNNVWLFAAGGLLLVGMAAGHRGMTLLGALVLVTAAAAWAWNRVCLAGVEYRRSLSADRALLGDEVVLTLTIVNRKPLPLPWLAIDEELSDGVRVLDRPTSPSGTTGRQGLRITTGLRAYERVTWRVRLTCPTRGLHTIGPGTLRSGDLFGFFTNRRPLPAATPLLVYPRVVDLPDLALPSREPIGEIRASRVLLADPSRVVGVRDYRTDDPFRSIHWKATARQGKLQVRVPEPTTALRLGIFLNLDTFDHYWEGLDLDLSERAIVVAASLAVWAEQTRYAVGIYANGLVAGSDQALRLPPGRGPGHLPRLLEGLAKVSPFSTLPFARVLAAEAPRFPYGATLAIVTSRMPEALAASLLQLLRAGHRVVLIPLGDCSIPALRGLIVRSVDEERIASPVGGVSPVGPFADPPAELEALHATT
jgi:uncharacterized protein (DUF58 family)